MADVWDDETATWEPSRQLSEDVEKSEGKENNVITRYEQRVHQADELAHMNTRATVSYAKQFAT